MLLAPQSDLQEVVSASHEALRCQYIMTREMRIYYGGMTEVFRAAPTAIILTSESLGVVRN